MVTRSVIAKMVVNNDFWFKGLNWLAEINSKPQENYTEIDTCEVIWVKGKPRKNNVIKCFCTSD